MNYSELSYPELQEIAKELNIPSHRVSKEDLITRIQEAKAAEDGGVAEVPTDEEAEEKKEIEEDAPEDTEVEEEDVEEVEEKHKVNTATVYDKDINHPVRSYTRDNHGKKFVSLANQFAERDTNYFVEERYVAPAQICRNCGAPMPQEA